MVGIVLDVEKEQKSLIGNHSISLVVSGGVMGSLVT